MNCKIFACDTQAHMEAPHFHTGARPASRAGVHRHLHHTPAAPMGRPCQSHGLRHPLASPHADSVGPCAAPERSTEDDLRSLAQQGPGSVQHRPYDVAGARRRSLGLARDAPPRLPGNPTIQEDRWKAARAAPGRSAAALACSRTAHRTQRMRMRHESDAHTSLPLGSLILHDTLMHGTGTCTVLVCASEWALCSLPEWL